VRLAWIASSTLNPSSSIFNGTTPSPCNHPPRSTLSPITHRVLPTTHATSGLTSTHHIEIHDSPLRRHPGSSRLIIENLSPLTPATHFDSLAPTMTRCDSRHSLDSLHTDSPWTHQESPYISSDSRLTTPLPLQHSRRSPKNHLVTRPRRLTPTHREDSRRTPTTHGPTTHNDDHTGIKCTTHLHRFTATWTHLNASFFRFTTHQLIIIKITHYRSPSRLTTHLHRFTTINLDSARLLFKKIHDPSVHLSPLTSHSPSSKLSTHRPIILEIHDSSIHH
jgi:hypothetical protein